MIQKTISFLFFNLTLAFFSFCQEKTLQFSKHWDSAVFDRGFFVEIYMDSIDGNACFFFSDSLPKINCKSASKKLIDKDGKILIFNGLSNTWVGYKENVPGLLSIQNPDTLSHHRCGKFNIAIKPMMLVYDPYYPLSERFDDVKDLLFSHRTIGPSRTIMSGVDDDQVVEVINALLLIPLDFHPRE